MRIGSAGRQALGFRAGPAWRSSSALVLAALTVQPALAQDSAQPQSGDVDTQTIVVTAQKRAQNVQDVPASVSVMGGDQLVATGATSLADYAAYAPGFNVSGGGTPGQAAISLRGLPPLSAGSVVGTYIDDTPVGSTGNFSAGTFFALDLIPYDLDRLEILRGPQGTLYGAGAMGGLVKYVLKAPSVSDFELRLGGELTDIRHGGDLGRVVRGMVSAPLVDGVLGVRLSGYDSRTPGYVDNAVTGARDVNDVHQYGGRLAFRFEPTSDLTLSANVMLARTASDDNAAVSRAIDGLPGDPDAPFLVTTTPIGGPLSQSFAISQPFRKAVDYYSLTAEWSLDFAELTSATSYARSDTRLVRDFSRFFGVLYPLLTDGAVDEGLTLFRTRLRHRKFTQELRLTSPTGGEIDWLVGAFYTRERARNADTAIALDTDYAPIAAFAPAFLASRTPSSYREIALFGEFTVRPVDALELTVGARHAWNRQSYQEINSGALAEFFGLAGTSEVRRSSEGVFTWSASARYHIDDDVMAYARVATGYRPGGPNFPGPGVPAEVAADKLTNYELGIKSELFDRKLVFNLSGFYIDWSGIQLNVDNGSGITFLGNAGDAEVYGVELETVARPVDGLSIGFNAAYTRSKLVNTVPGAEPFFLGVQLPNIPKWSFGATADYRIPVSAGLDIDIGGAWRHVARSHAAAVMTQAGRPSTTLPAYDLVDLRAGVSADRWAVRLFVRNLTDSRGLTGISSAGVDAQTDFTIVQPRTVGISLDLTF